jgi:uncharacterized protein YndB with AHSA1/START domain
VDREIVLPASPASVWESLTRPDRLAAWLGAEVELDLRPGGALRLGPPDAGRRGVVEAVRPAEYLAIRWRFVSVGPDGPVFGPGTRVEFLLEPDGGGTRLRVLESLTEPLPGAGTQNRTLAMVGGGGR